MQEMPVLYEKRVGYFDFCLQAAIKSQVWPDCPTHQSTYSPTVVLCLGQALYYQDCSRSLHEALSKLQGSSELMSEDEITRNTEKCLADIRSLSIVGGTPAL